MAQNAPASPGGCKYGSRPDHVTAGQGRGTVAKETPAPDRVQGRALLCSGVTLFRVYLKLTAKAVPLLSGHPASTLQRVKKPLNQLLCLGNGHFRIALFALPVCTPHFQRYGSARASDSNTHFRESTRTRSLSLLPSAPRRNNRIVVSYYCHLTALLSLRVSRITAGRYHSAHRRASPPGHSRIARPSQAARTAHRPKPAISRHARKTGL
jgi:hypothetical protein